MAAPIQDHSATVSTIKITETHMEHMARRVVSGVVSYARPSTPTCRCAFVADCYIFPDGKLTAWQIVLRPVMASPSRAIPGRDLTALREAVDQHLVLIPWSTVAFPRDTSVDVRAFLKVDQG